MYDFTLLWSFFYNPEGGLMYFKHIDWLSEDNCKLIESIVCAYILKI